ncbi:hypothetical protein D3C71_1720370 [compost metagenome]
MLISPVSQLPSQPCLVFEKPAALKIWLASLAGTVGLVSAKVVVLSRASVESIRMVVFIFVL